MVALVADNGAGKSTLVKTIAGVHPIDEGVIEWDGKAVQINKPHDAQHLGVATVYQDLALCDNLDVVANLFLGQEEIADGPGGLLRKLAETALAERAQDLLEHLAAHVRVSLDNLRLRELV